MSQVPLVVDLDGTFILTDMLHETAVASIAVKPWLALKFPGWLSQGKSVLKDNLSDYYNGDVRNIPVHEEFVSWLKDQKAEGRHIILATASNEAIAHRFGAMYDEIFDEVMASSASHNLIAGNKAQALIDRFGEKGFDYAGNSKADLAIWKHARKAIIVNASDSVKKAAYDSADVEREFKPFRPTTKTWLKLIRVHQWMKNILLFMPLLAAHDSMQLSHWIHLIPAFLSFCLCASFVYIANDLTDLANDRAHARKKKRPIAAGLITIPQAITMLPILAIGSVFLALFTNQDFLWWLAGYFILTCSYSFGLKRVVMLDCLMLSALYTVRILAGAAAAGFVMTFWLLAFSIFLFLSLAFVKRYAELHQQEMQGIEKATGRGYYTSDARFIQMLGVVSGYVSVLVFSLYINSATVLARYTHPEIVWGAVFVLLFWVSWVWMRTHRGEMHDDPVIFALKDRTSLVCGAFFALFMVAGTVF